jgi:hypothetical protein
VYKLASDLSTSHDDETDCAILTCLVVCGLFVPAESIDRCAQLRSNTKRRLDQRKNRWCNLEKHMQPAQIVGKLSHHDLQSCKGGIGAMSLNQFQLTRFSKRVLEECQKWRNENYERNTKKAKTANTADSILGGFRIAPPANPWSFAKIISDNRF